jgi:hypothetical protein
MRTGKAFFSLAVVAAATLLAATSAVASAPPQTCTTNDGQWFVSAVGPSDVSCGSGNCKEIDYAISPIAPNSGTPDHVAILVGGTNTSDVIVPGGIQVYPPCSGDPVTGLGQFACQEMAVKVNPDPYKKAFPLVVRGGSPITTTIATKKGKKPVGYCSIIGLGVQPPPPPDGSCVPSCGGFHPFQELKKFETIVFKGCAVTFEYDLTDGHVVSAVLDEENSKPGCTFHEDVVENILVTIPGVEGVENSLVRFGDGYWSHSNNSCTTRIIGGKTYTWGDPCP